MSLASSLSVRLSSAEDNVLSFEHIIVIQNHDSFAFAWRISNRFRVAQLYQDNKMTDNFNVKNMEFDEQAQCAAFLRATFNMSQAEIGLVLGGLSQPQVSRLLSHAEKNKYLVVEYRFAVEKFSEERLCELQNLLAPSQLMSGLDEFCNLNNVPTPRVRVFDSGTGTTEAALAQRRTKFGRLASGRVIELIEKSDTVGIAWGRTIKSVVSGIGISRRPISKSEYKEFVAVCAELLSIAQRGYSSSRIAELLDETYNVNRINSPQLTGFPAYVPQRYDEETQKSIWRYISETPAYYRTFSGPDPLVDKIDLLITSVGSSDSLVLGMFDELVPTGNTSPHDLRKLIAGDLCGLIIPRPELSESKLSLIDKINEAWTGIKMDQVKSIVRRAVQNPELPGVVVMALQKERGDAIIEVVRNGLANELIIDQDLASYVQSTINSNTP